MSTPSQRPLSFNACSSLPLSSTPVNHSVAWQNGLCYTWGALLCSRLSFGCGLERYSNRRKSLIVGLKGLAACCLQGYHPTCSTKGAWWHFYEEVCLYNHIHAHCVLLVQLFSSVSADYPSLTWVALSIPITTCISTVSKQPSLKVPPPIHHPFQPQSSPSLQA